MLATASSDECCLHQRLLVHEIGALAQVYDGYAATVFGVALRVTHDRQAAEDVTQEVLLGLWCRPERFDPDRGGMRPWLAVAAHHRGVDWIRREQARRRKDRARVDLALAEAGCDVAGDVQSRMTAQRVRAAVAALPAAEQQAVRLAFFAGRSYRQVAADLDEPEGTIKSRIRSGLRHLSISMHREHVLI